MKCSPRLAIVCCAAILTLNSGCLITRYKTNVVRQNEKPRAVKFESSQAKNIFDGKEIEAKTRLTGPSNPRIVAVPFLLLWSSTDVVSDNGIYNDQLAICDSNGDGFITTDEATTYSAKVDQMVAQRNANNEKIATQVANAATGEPVANTSYNAPPSPYAQPAAPQPLQAQQTSDAPLPPASYR